MLWRFNDWAFYNWFASWLLGEIEKGNVVEKSVNIFNEICSVIDITILAISLM